MTKRTITVRRPVNALPERHLKVGCGCGFLVGSNADVLHDDGLSCRAGNLDINTVRAKAALLLEEVVVSTLSSLPSLAAVSADLEALDGNVGVDNLHREPPARSPRLVEDSEGS